MSLFWNHFSHYKMFHFIPLRLFIASFRHLCLAFPRGLFPLFSPSSTSCTRATCFSHPPSRGNPNHLSQCEPTNALNCTKLTMALQHTNCCMFRPHWPIINENTAVHYSCPEHKLLQLLYSVRNSVSYINITLCSFRQHCYMQKSWATVLYSCVLHEDGPVWGTKHVAVDVL